MRAKKKKKRKNIGLLCVLTLEGYGFNDTNRLVILDKGPLSTAGFVSCGGSGAREANWTGTLAADVRKACVSARS